MCAEITSRAGKTGIHANLVDHEIRRDRGRAREGDLTGEQVQGLCGQVFAKVHLDGAFEALRGDVIHAVPLAALALHVHCACCVRSVVRCVLRVM